MAEYIEREAAMLTPVLPKAYRQYQTGNLDDAYECGWDDALHNLKSLPAADVAPVVRCRDCRCFERQGEYNGGMPYGYCYHWDYEQGGLPNMVDGSDFCSYGERKDGGE